MAGNDDLHPILSKIHQTLGDILKSVRQVKGEVEKVRTAITKGAESIRDAIHENIQAQAELKMMERVVEVRSLLPQIEAEKERIETEKEDLDDQLQRIAERYEKKHEELDEKAASRIRDLGSHIFEIDEEEFEEGIESPFAEHVTTTWSSFRSHNDTVGRDRRNQVESRTGDVVAEVHDFVRQQEELVDRIEKVRTQQIVQTDIDEGAAEPRRIQLPYYAVTVEVNGSTRNHVVGPSEVSAGDGGAHDVGLEPLPGVSELISRTELNRTRSEAVDVDRVQNRLKPWIDDDRPLVSYGEGLSMAVSDDLTIALEGE